MPDKTRIPGNLVSDNNIFVNPTTDNTGIGTISPVAKLDVVGNVRISSNLNVSGISTTGTFNIGTGRTIFTSLSNGYIGIGTTNPTRVLQVVGDSSTNQFNTALAIRNVNTTGFGAYVGLNATSITSGREWRLVSVGTSESAGVGKFSIYDVTAGLDRVVIDSSGNVGLGTTNPNVRFSVLGNASISGITTLGLGSTSTPTTNSTMSFELTNNTTLTIRVKGTDGTIRTGTIALA